MIRKSVRSFFLRDAGCPGPTGAGWTLAALLFLTGCATVPSARPPLALNLAPYRVAIGGTPYLPSWAIIQEMKGSSRWDNEAQVWHARVGSHTLSVAPQVPAALVDGTLCPLAKPPLLKEGEIYLPEVLWSRWLIHWRIPEAAPPGVSPFKTIVIDAGHGGHDPGAIGRGGLREKSVTLDIALRLRDLLRQEGFQAVMTRGADRFISLSRRSEIANTEAGDLFLSIHANSSRSRGVSGYEVYYLSEATDDQTRALEAAENVTLPEEVGDSVPEASQAIVWDLLYTEHRAESVELARSIVRGLSKTGIPSQNRGVKSARFAVLKSSRMPAVLVEVGFVSHPVEEERLRGPHYRQRIAEGIRNGILYFKISQKERD